jgi:hypothetical protein
MSIRSELLSLQHSDPQNVLHAEDAISWAAENPNSDLHAALEWNDQKAAHEHRLSQVRHLIQLHVVNDDSTPMLVSLSIDRRRGGGYRSLDEVGRVPELREVLLADALAELERVQTKYARVTELMRVWEEAERARAIAPEPVRRRGRPRVSA